MNLSETAKRAINAYGGKTLWRNAGHIAAEVSVSGLAFTLKRRPFFCHAQMVEEIHRPFSKLTPIGRHPGVAGILDGKDVRLANEDGEVVSERKKARDFFRFGRRVFWWDDLDMSYFANYAFWNYFTLPALLMREDVAWRELAPGHLEACFPETIPTHCRIQRFRFSPQTGLLLQHDYTADIISRFAFAAHEILEHTENDGGLVYISKRRVTPRGITGKPIGFPVLIDIEVHDYQLIEDDNSV